jgi:hypothetical protein
MDALLFLLVWFASLTIVFVPRLGQSGLLPLAVSRNPLALLMVNGVEKEMLIGCTYM